MPGKGLAAKMASGIGGTLEPSGLSGSRKYGEKAWVMMIMMAINYILYILFDMECIKNVCFCSRFIWTLPFGNLA